MRSAWGVRVAAGAGLAVGVLGAGLAVGAGGAGASATGGATVPGGPAIDVPGPAGLAPQGAGVHDSGNWSGYDLVGGPFTSVSASWVQPTATCTTGSQFSAFWVGIDGDAKAGHVDDSVEQTGTEADCHGGTAVYSAWWEMYPQGSNNLHVTVVPGDHISASVTGTAAGNFTLVISDGTQGWSRTVHATYAPAKLASAEIIAEAPSNGVSILPLTDFGTVSYTSAMVDGTTLGAAGTPREMVMVKGGGAVKAQPGPLRGGDAFSITWVSH